MFGLRRGAHSKMGSPAPVAESDGAAATMPTPSTSATPSANPVATASRYLALGDSFTIGTGSAPEVSFPARLAARWQVAGCPATLKNLGVNGYTTDDVTSEELPEVKGFAPTLVTLAVGANDIVRGRSAEEYRAHVKQIFAAIVKDGVPPARIVALPQPYWSSSPAASSFGTEQELATKITSFNGILAAEAQAVGGRYVDLSARMQKQAAAKMLAGDGLHPSAAAYDEWAGDIDAALGSCAAR